MTRGWPVIQPAGRPRPAAERNRCQVPITHSREGPSCTRSPKAPTAVVPGPAAAGKTSHGTCDASLRGEEGGGAKRGGKDEEEAEEEDEQQEESELLRERQERGGARRPIQGEKPPGHGHERGIERQQRQDEAAQSGEEEAHANV